MTPSRGVGGAGYGAGVTIEQRQAYALAHPVTDPVAVLADPVLYDRRQHRRGFLLLSILAVDR